MPTGPRAKTVVVSSEDRVELEQRARAQHVRASDVQRAKIILQVSDDPCVAVAAREMNVRRKTIRKWRDRYIEEGLAGLEDRPRSGRPLRIDPVSRCEVVSIACAKPCDFQAEFRDIWTYQAIAETFSRIHPELPISRTAVIRILGAEDFKPHRVRPWLHSPDPEFRSKVSVICSLYVRPPLERTVLCVDEKPGIQVLGRKYPSSPPLPGKAGRREYEYIRNGTRALLGAFNPHTGHVTASIGPSRKADDLVGFMETVAEVYPEGPVDIIWDNLNIHFDGPSCRWTTFNERHGNRFHFHYTPVHASWVNQIEMFFAILQKRVIRFGIFDSIDQVDDAVLGFIDRWNEVEGHPFEWNFKGYTKSGKRRVRVA